MKNMVYWWIFYWIQIIGYVVAGFFDVFQMAWTADISKISFLIIFLHIATTIWIGLSTHITSRKGHNHDVHLDAGWFMAEACMMLGMIGTIIGFIYTLVSTLGSMGSVNPAQLQAIIHDLARGIGTAGWTTLFGLIASLSIKLQMNNLESLSAR